LTLLDLAREEVRDARLRALRQLERDLTPDGVDTRLDRELRDAGAHRAQADDADLHARESRRGPSSAIAAPATAISESDTVSPTPRARKPISGPFTTPPVYPAVATDAMPALEEIPGVAAATRNSAGTIAAQPAPTRANPTKPGTAERAASASTMPATTSAPPRRASPDTPQRTSSGSPASRAATIATEYATTPPAAIAALVCAGPDRKTALQFTVDDSTNIEQNVRNAGRASAPDGSAKCAVSTAASAELGSSFGVTTNAAATTPIDTAGNCVRTPISAAAAPAAIPDPT